MCLEEEMRSRDRPEVHCGRRVDDSVDSVDLQAELRFPPYMRRSKN